MVHVYNFSAPVVDKQQAEILQTREKQLEQAQHQLATLTSERDTLTRKIQEAQLQSQQFENLKNEFSKRLAQEEKKVYQLRKEKDEIKKDVEKNNSSAKDKEEIEKLLAEGERLSKQVGNLEASLKKYRQQIKDNETTIGTLTKQVEQGKNDMGKMRETQDEGFSQQIQQKDGKITALETENVSLKQQVAEWSSKYEQGKVDAEQTLKRRIQEKVEFYEAQLAQWKQTVGNLESNIQIQQEQYEKRLEQNKKELEQYQLELKNAEGMYQEALSGIPDATRPLVEELAAVEKNFLAKEDAFKEQEKRLNYRVQIAENKIKLLEQEAANAVKNAERFKNKQQEAETQCQDVNTKLQQEMKKNAHLVEQLSASEIQRLKFEKEALHSKQDFESKETQLQQQIKRLETEVANALKKQQAAITTPATPEKQASSKPASPIDYPLSPSISIAANANPDSKVSLLETTIRQQNIQLKFWVERANELDSIKSKLCDEMVAITAKNNDMYLCFRAINICG